MISIYGIESDRRCPSVRRGIKFPNRPSPFSSSLIGRAVCQTLNAIASAFNAPFSSSSIGREFPQTLEAVASALNVCINQGPHSRVMAYQGLFEDLEHFHQFVMAKGKGCYYVNSDNPYKRLVVFPSIVMATQGQPLFT
ncbi:unnamed protein product [Prunus armeniaca]